MSLVLKRSMFCYTHLFLYLSIQPWIFQCVLLFSWSFQLVSLVFDCMSRRCVCCCGSFFSFFLLSSCQKRHSCTPQRNAIWQWVDPFFFFLNRVFNFSWTWVELNHVVWSCFFPACERVNRPDRHRLLSSWWLDETVWSECLWGKAEKQREVFVVGHLLFCPYVNY